MDRPGLISPHFHFEQRCWQINGYKETHLNWLYYSGCLEYPSSHDGNRLGSQKKMEVQRDFAGLLSICLKPAHEKCRLADSGLAVNSARWLLCPAPSPAQHGCRGTLAACAGETDVSACPSGGGLAGTQPHLAPLGMWASLRRQPCPCLLLEPAGSWGSRREGVHGWENTWWGTGHPKAARGKDNGSAWAGNFWGALLFLLRKGQFSRKGQNQSVALGIFWTLLTWKACWGSLCSDSHLSAGDYPD